MTQSDFIPVLIQLVLAAGLAVAIIGASHLFGQRGPSNAIKNTAYECGVKPLGKASVRFSVKFYVTAMLFILFDIEILYLVPWALAYREFLAAGLPVFWPALFFVAVLAIGLLYEAKKGALDWEK